MAYKEKMKVSKSSTYGELLPMVAYKTWAKEHPNFMTPDVIKVKKSGDTFIELSKGEGFENDTIYGVSFIKRKYGKFITGEDSRSKVFTNKEDALKHYNKY